MVRITGNVFISFIGLLVFSMVQVCSAAADMSIRMVHREDGAPLSYAEVGRPFVIEVTVQEVARVGQYPTIQGLSAGMAKNVGINMRTINGRTTVSYMYEVRIDKAGMYDIGPARLDDGHTVLESGMLQVEVREGTSSQEHDVEKKEKVFMRFSVDKTNVVVGERISCALRFYARTNATIKQLIEQEMPSMDRKQMHGPIEGTERVDGTQYHYAEWTWALYPKQAGTFVIPAWGADYEEPIERDHYWGGLGRFFGNRFETKRLYANAVSLKVSALPAHEKTIDAIGTFSSFQVCANPSMAGQGEGITVTIEIVGKGELESIKRPVLQKVPDALKWYESKKTLTEDDVGQQTLVFEFVVQGLKPGTWTIPAQTFHYYDVERSTYRTLKSAPLEIVITPRAACPISSSPGKSLDEKQEGEIEMLAPLHDVANCKPCSTMHIPWRLMILFVLLPIGGILTVGLLKIMAEYRARFIRRMRAKNAFMRGLSLLREARAKGDLKGLYLIFVESIADRVGQPPSAVTGPFIEQMLQERTIANETIEAWRSFFETIMHEAYSNQINVQDQLFNEAEQWLKQLDSYLQGT